MEAMYLTQVETIKDFNIRYAYVKRQLREADYIDYQDSIGSEDDPCWKAIFLKRNYQPDSFEEEWTLEEYFMNILVQLAYFHNLRFPTKIWFAVNQISHLKDIGFPRGTLRDGSIFDYV